MRHKILGFSFLAFVLLGMVPPTWAMPTSGSNFWVCFPYAPLPSGGAEDLVLLLSSNVATTATVFDPSVGTSAPYAITPGTTTPVTILSTSQLHPWNDDTVTHMGVQVTAPVNITVYGMNFISYDSDGYLALPDNAIGTNYIVVNNASSGNFPTEFVIVGTENGTNVNITPSVAAGSRAAGVLYSITLNKGDTYELATSAVGGDLTGTLIQSSNPVAVFGDTAGMVPAANNFTYYAEELEEIWPVSAWGTNFVTIPLATRTGGDTFRFVASTNGTTVNVNGTALPVLNQGQLIQQIVAAPAWITANNPIYVAQFSNSATYDNSGNADPFMITVPPISQYGTAYETSVLPVSFSPNLENILVPNAAVGSVLLDGTAIPAASFTAIGASGYSGAAVTVSPVEHVLTGPSAFGALIYGFHPVDGYGYPAGVFVAGTAVPTSTPANTWTPMPTNTPTGTPTPTPTKTPTNTPTPTITNTPPTTPTFTMTSTPTNTPTPTITPTWTSTFTPTCVIHVWPNPYSLQHAHDHALKFSCLSSGSQVSIYTLSGELVVQFGPAGDPTEWVGAKNHAGAAIAPGIYFYVIQDGQTVLQRGKFLILP